MPYYDFKPRRRAKGAGRPVSHEGNNYFCRYLKENDLSVTEFYDLAEQVLSTKHPDLFPPPPFSRLTELRTGKISPNDMSVKNIVKLCVLLGCTPNELIINTTDPLGRW